MKAMARQRSHSIAFKRQVAQEFIARESLYALSKRHDISRQLIRVWVETRFKLYGFNEICRMTSSEWDEECRRNNADFEESPEEAYVRECIEAREKGLDPDVDDRGRAAEMRSSAERKISEANWEPSAHCEREPSSVS
jgi:transposase-like protein